MGSENRSADSSGTGPGIDNNNGNDMISLVHARVGSHYKIVEIDGGCEVQTRLASMGILPGQIIRILKSGNFGPTMICVKGARVALGAGVGYKIMVRPDTQIQSIRND
jgi:Fe2+ transport system protein FeoA